VLFHLSFPNSGASACETCGVGKYTPNASATECLECTPGKFMAAPGQSKCDNCPAGFFTVGNGKAKCMQCQGKDSCIQAGCCRDREMLHVSWFLVLICLSLMSLITPLLGGLKGRWESIQRFGVSFFFCARAHSGREHVQLSRKRSVQKLQRGLFRETFRPMRSMPLGHRLLRAGEKHANHVAD